MFALCKVNPESQPRTWVQIIFQEFANVGFPRMYKVLVNKPVGERCFGATMFANILRVLLFRNKLANGSRKLRNYFTYGGR